MRRLKNWLRQKIVNVVLEEIKVGGNCGACGAWVPNCLVWYIWPYTVCDKCAAPPTLDRVQLSWIKERTQ